MTEPHRTLVCCGVSLTLKDVNSIRVSERPYDDIAERFGITTRAVADLKAREYPNQREFEEHHHGRHRPGV